MNNEFVILSDEELEMVAGGTISQSASAAASSTQAATATLNNVSVNANLGFTANQDGSNNNNTAAAASTAAAGNIAQVASNTAIAVNGVRSKQFNTLTF